MNIRTPRELKSFASERLAAARDQKRIVLIYSGVILGMSALVTVLSYVLGLQIDQLGGLSHLSTRKILSSVQSMLPIAQSLVTMCLNVGFLAAMLRVARGQYVSPQTLRLGFDRFWVLLRCTVVKALMYTAVAVVGIYAGMMIFMMTPLSGSAVELLTPYLSDASILNSGIVLEDAVYDQLMLSLIPAYGICGLIICVAAVPMMYSYRMANYVIIDRPAMGAMAALRESKKMMRGNRMAMFKLDLSMWWYYGALFVATLVCYGDMILPLFGVTLPGHEDIWYFVFFAVYLVLTFGIYYTMLNRVEVTYGLAYDAVKPEEKQDNSVVLGNIFQM